MENLRQIQKRTAKKLYESGEDVLFIPCKLNPYNDFWMLGMWENKKLAGQLDSFEKLCNAFIYYNCTSCTGRYIHFYIRN